MALVKDLIASVQSTLQDNSPPFRRWPEAELIRYVNYARQALAKYLPQVSSRTDAIKLAAGSLQNIELVPGDSLIPDANHLYVDDFGQYVDIRGIALLRALCNMGADGVTPGRAIRGPVDRYTKDSFEPNWLAETGPEVKEIIFDKNLPTQFLVSPAVPAATDLWIRIHWMANLPDLPPGEIPGNERYVVGGDEQDTSLGVPEQFTEDIHNYVVAVALLKGSKNMQNLPKAQVHAQLFMQSINTQATVATGINPNISALPFVNAIAA